MFMFFNSSFILKCDNWYKMPESPVKTTPKWQHPAEVLKLQKLRIKKRSLQSRIKGTSCIGANEVKANPFENILTSQKRKNPFSKEDSSKKNKSSPPACNLEESSDQTLFKLLHNDTQPTNTRTSLTSFDNILNKLSNNEYVETVEVVKAHGEKWLPIDWTLKDKLRLLSFNPFPWNQKLKLSEEASGVTGFTRCLDVNSRTYLDTSPNAKFHQCCLYWQQPSLPWVKLFPRSTNKSSGTGVTVANNSEIRDSLQNAWFDGLRSLFQLIRTRQCPYFYVCANNFTVLFRAAGICGFSDVHALISPTTRGFRRLLQSEDIEYEMPLKKKRLSDQGYDTMDTTCSEVTQEIEPENIDDEDDNDEVNEDVWLKSLGINCDDIKQIKYTQQKIVHKAECQVDNSEQSIVLIKGTEVHSFYNFLLNCKSIISISGSLAGIPPTLLAPVAFNGATLNAVKVREHKVKVDDTNYYSIELSGPILPTTVHNIFSIHPPEHSLTATCHNLTSTIAFSKILPNEKDKIKSGIVFVKENLSDCGLNETVLKHFCTVDSKYIVNVECVKYDSDTKTYTWT